MNRPVASRPITQIGRSNVGPSQIASSCSASSQIRRCSSSVVSCPPNASAIVLPAIGNRIDDPFSTPRRGRERNGMQPEGAAARRRELLSACDSAVRPRAALPTERDELVARAYAPSSESPGGLEYRAMVRVMEEIAWADADGGRAEYAFRSSPPSALPAVSARVLEIWRARARDLRPGLRR
jgi:hypothetical protein